MNKTSFALKGNIFFTPAPGQLAIYPESYLVCVEQKVAGVFAQLPEQYKDLPVEDHSGKLILPGLVDLHVHASQYAYRGLGMDMELLQWLEANAFPEESKFADPEYAEKAYGIFTQQLLHSATTRACIFATIHRPATLKLMELLEKAGLCCYVGKVNMDRNSPDILRETCAESLAETRQWLLDSAAFTKSKPMLTPRFTPSCTDELMAGLGKLQKEFGVPMQSHLSENLSEIKWVSELCPGTRFYGEAYEQFGLFGGECPTVMAHCVWSGAEERARMKANGVFIAHCPQSNMNVSSGIAPIKSYLLEGQKVGLGSDVAGGAHLSIFRAMTDAIQCSKLRWRLVDQSTPALTMPDVLYLATKGGGAFFGKVGSFEPGYEFDAIVMDDSNLPTTRLCSLPERLERMVYLGDGAPCAKYVQGQRLF
ncbi:amidohydrolase family protein [Allofournierella sp. CML151]|uniref:amidohydrolase family protein n=1 Tax=Allofournierella sp. CML151 TaxID=2998082 RepID=UPI0022EAB8F9|nr:amidohydrolase family protein [Fournierella sp. CML151]